MNCTAPSCRCISPCEAYEKAREVDDAEQQRLDAEEWEQQLCRSCLRPTYMGHPPALCQCSDPDVAYAHLSGGGRS